MDQQSIKYICICIKKTIEYIIDFSLKILKIFDLIKRYGQKKSEKDFNNTEETS